MTRLIFWRLVQLPFLLLIIYTVTFLLAWMIPGNPLEMDDARQPSPEIREAMLAQYNLDNQWVFYWEYLGNALQGDLGPSLRAKDWRVSEIIGSALPVSLQLGLGAILFAVLIGVTTGVIGSVRKGGVMDNATLAVALVGISLPTFVTGSLLLLIFTVNLGWLPVGWGSAQLMLLPAISLSLPFGGYIARLTRLGMIEVL
ncbi:MAG: ABC transporter permease, partial [Phycisphaeraceae bacterium]